MRKSQFSKLIVLLIVLQVALGFGVVSAQADSKFPERPITLVVPWAAGGSSDLMARTIAPLLRERLGQPVNVVNKPGANGTVATAEVARAKADGYTLLLDAVGVFTVQPSLRPVQYSLESFRGVSGLSMEDIVVAVNADSPWQTFDDLVADVRESGKTITFSHSGAGSLPHLSQAALLQSAGIEGRAVPYDGGAPALTALVGGHVDMTAGHPPSIMPQVEAGTLRVLGVMSSERSEQVPDVPTFNEQGYDLGNYAVWKFILVPAGTSDAVTEKLSEAFEWAMQQPEWKNVAEKLNFASLPISGDEVIRRLEAESGDYQSVLDELGMGQ